MSMQRTMSTLGVTFAVAILASCSVLTEPDGNGLPPRDYSLDPRDLVEPRTIHACGQWRGGVTPTEENIVVDVAFVSPDLDDPDDRPYARHLNLVKRHGGKVLHEFNVPAARIRIATAKVPSLSAENDVMSVFEVRNPSRFDWPVFVGYEAGYSYIDGGIRFAQLGGKVTSRYNSINAIYGLIPDHVIPVLRNNRNVDHVESGGWFCIL